MTFYNRTKTLLDRYGYDYSAKAIESESFFDTLMRENIISPNISSGIQYKWQIESRVKKYFNNHEYDYSELLKKRLNYKSLCEESAKNSKTKIQLLNTLLHLNSYPRMIVSERWFWEGDDSLENDNKVEKLVLFKPSILPGCIYDEIEITDLDKIIIENLSTNSSFTWNDIIEEIQIQAGIDKELESKVIKLFFKCLCYYDLIEIES
jgi:hypothetical protein